MPPKAIPPAPGGGLSRFFAKASDNAPRSVFEDDNFNHSAPRDQNDSNLNSSKQTSSTASTASTASTTTSHITTSTPSNIDLSPALPKKQPRSAYCDSDDGSDEDQIIIKPPLVTAAPISTTTTTRSTTVTPLKKQRSSKYAESSSYSEVTSSSSGDDDYTSGESSDDSTEFESQEKDATKKKRTVTTAPKKTPPRIPKNSATVGSSHVTLSSEDDNNDNRNYNRVVTIDNAVNKASAMDNKVFNFDDYLSTGHSFPSAHISKASNHASKAIIATTTTTTDLNTSSTSTSKKSHQPLLSSFHGFQLPLDSDDDEEEGGNPNGSKIKTNDTTKTSTLASAMGEYELPNFVLPENIKDKSGRRPNHPDYDPRTLLVPTGSLSAMTPAQQQFWSIKSDNMDLVLLFKVGKFYELFDLDAEVGIKELGLLRMGSDKRLHVGFPEMGYAKYAKMLVDKGYRVACAEQTQTPDQMKAHNDTLPRGHPKQKIVNRHICSLVTPGTGVADTFLKKPSTFLLSIVEHRLNTNQQTTINTGGDVTFNRVSYNEHDTIYGIAYVDTATGAFQVGSFIDNTNKTSLKALLTQVQPAEVLYYRDSFSSQTQNILNTETPGDCLHTPYNITQRMKSENCIAKLSNHFKPFQQRKHAGSQVKRINPNNIDQATGWPKILAKYKNDLEHLDQEDDEMKVSSEHFIEKKALIETFWSAFGLLYLYLERVLLEKELIPLCRFKLYQPIEGMRGLTQDTTSVNVHAASNTKVTNITTTNTTITTAAATATVSTTERNVLQSPLHHASYESENDHLILDSQTLTNLEILLNGEGGLDGTLISYLDHCQTAFGKRLLRKWICSPLFRVEDINNRLDAVAELTEHFDIVKKVSAKLTRVPDLERSLARIRANSLKRDIEAIMYGDIGKQQVELFLKCLEGFEAAMRAIYDLMSASHGWFSPLLRKLLFLDNEFEGDGGDDDDDVNTNPNLFFAVQQLLEEFRDSFDHAKARKDGNITPKPGVVDDYDDANTQTLVLEQKLSLLLQKYRAQFGNATSVVWTHKNKETYQLEIPLDVLGRYPNVVTTSFEQVSSTSKVRRYYTPEIKQLAKEYDEAKENRDVVLKDVTRQVFEKFSSDYHVWSSVLDSIANIDCLLSLATASKVRGGTLVCRPNVIDVKDTPDQKPLLQLRNAVHPTVATSGTLAHYAGAPKVYIPNDVDIGTEENPSRFVIVSGPNMGGKSTLLRQVCCCIILAQIGCFVPAEKMSLTPIDRIFTRVGASDRILQGQSTFLVELEETSHILRHATSRSFVILDELGRGTSTFDGTAIAHSVVQFLSQKVECMTLFTTHYHMLLQDYRHNPLVSMYHMAYKVNLTQGNNDNDDNNNNNNRKNTSDNHHVQSVTFLYKFLKGVCNKSFGLHVAALANIPTMVIDVAYERGEWFSASFEQQDTKYNKLLKRFIIALYHNDFNTLRQIRQEFAAPLTMVTTNGP